MAQIDLVDLCVKKTCLMMNEQTPDSLGLRCRQPALRKFRHT